MAYIADTVHYVETVDDQPVCRAALVLRQGGEPDYLWLAVFATAQPYAASEIPFNATPTGGSWHRAGGQDCSN